MNHEEIQELLESYVDDRLDRQTRREVDQHLKSCDECRAILEGVTPVDLAAVGPASFDQESLRRMGRRSVFRTAWSALVMIVAGLILLLIISALIYQPLVIDRSNRAAYAARATIDAISMVNPGAVVVDGEIQSGLWHRDLVIEAVIPVGSGIRVLEPLELRLGALSLSAESGAPPSPYLMSNDSYSDAFERLPNLGSGTVATVQIQFGEAITMGEAQAIADATDYDTRVIWAGFDLLRTTEEPIPVASAGYLGYGTCLGDDPFGDDLLGASSAGFSRSPGSAPASIERSLASVIYGLQNLKENPEWISNLTLTPGSVDDVTEALDALSESPRVLTLVFTGPSDEIAAQLAEMRGASGFAQVLAVDFYNWAPGLCGR